MNEMMMSSAWREHQLMWRETHNSNGPWPNGPFHFMDSETGGMQIPCGQRKPAFTQSAKCESLDASNG